MNISRSVGTGGMETAEFVILLWAAALGTSFFSLAPALVGGLVDHAHLSVRDVGLISSGELASAALGSALVLVYGRSFSVRATLILSLALAGVANLATAAAHDFNTIAACRGAAGLGGGLAFAVVNAVAARAAKPGPKFAAISVAQMMFGVVGFASVPTLIGAFGLAGVFLLLGLGCLGCSIASAIRLTCEPIHDSAPRSSLSVTPRGVLLLISLFATYLTSTALWMHLERIGVASRLAGEVISIGLSIGSMSGVLGTLAATLLLIRARDTNRFVIGGAAIMALSTGLLIKAAAPAAYLTALFGFNGALALVTPLYLTRLAGESSGDRRVLLAMLAMYLGLILGPMLGAGLVAGPGFEDLIHVAMALFLTAALLAIGSSHLTPQMVRS
ncbi:MAG: MFS transporter [Steroidobacteraceae bacterium]